VTLAAGTDPVLSGPVALLSPTADDRARSALAQAARLLLDAFTEPPRTTAIVVTDYLRFGPRRFLSTLRSMLDDRIEDRIARIPGPVLVVRGTRDVLAPRRWAAALAGRAAVGRLAEVAGAGHVVQDAAPQQVARLCRELAGPAAAGSPSG
jgi:pimeloyl-ACP methyl ester carboxylesterase